MKKHKLESRLLGEISITSDMQMTPLMAESEEELTSLFGFARIPTLSCFRVPTLSITLIFEKKKSLAETI